MKNYVYTHKLYANVHSNTYNNQKMEIIPVSMT